MSSPQYAEHGHLGGYIIGGDDATFYPHLWRWLVEEQGIRSVLDVGCGEGHAIDFFAELGCHVLGIEGVPQENERILQHDYTQRPYSIPGWTADLAWSCEFVEHVEERHVPNFLPSFASAKLVLMTHAAPGQAGYHHVNCQPEAYWRGAMAAIGYVLDDELTQRTRLLAGMNRNPHNHYARSGLAFRTSGRREKMGEP
jgi:hypothetical protein